MDPVFSSTLRNHRRNFVATLTYDVNNVLLIDASQIRDGDKVVSDSWNVGVILTQIKGSIVLECQLILIVQLAVLFVGIFH